MIIKPTNSWSALGYHPVSAVLDSVRDKILLSAEMFSYHLPLPSMPPPLPPPHTHKSHIPIQHYKLRKKVTTGK